MAQNEIASLPDNYDAAAGSGEFGQQYDPANASRSFLPPDLLRGESSWVCIAGSQGPIAKLHVMDFSGRSRFIEFMRLPQGQKATLKYLHTLWDSPQPWIGDPGGVVLNPALP